MTDWKTTHYQYQPSELDTTSSPTTVYERKNIHEVTVTMGEETITEWECLEKQYTTSEYESLNSPATKAIMQDLSAMELSIAEME